MHTVLVVSSGREIIHYFDPDEQLARREQLRFAKGTTEALPNRPFHILMSNSTCTKLNIQKRRAIGQASTSLSTIVDLEVASHQPPANNLQEINTVNFVSNDSG